MAIKCCDRPSGNNVFLPMMFTTIAFILSNTSDTRCDFAFRQFNSPDPRYWVLVGDTQVGMWSYEVTGSCFIYPASIENTISDDTRFKSARIFSVWTTISGGIMLICIWFSSCFGYPRMMWALLGFFLMLNCIFEGLSLLLMSSSVCDERYGTCSLARGSRCSISATVFWFLAGISVASVPAPKGPEPVVVQETTTTTETVSPDGTKTTVTKTETKTVPGV